MEFFKNLDLKPVTLLKVGVLAVVGIFVLSLVISLLGNSFPMRNANFFETPSYGKGAMMVASDASYGGMPELSMRNIAPMPPMPGTTGNNAEEFEVTDYNASIETRDSATTCGAILKLKSLSHVIFESANESDTACYYTFKVEHAHVPEVLATVKDLNPKDLSENTYTIKRQVEDYTSEITILEKKLDAIEATLSSALRAYDDVTALATRTQDVESLAKIIDSKIQIIERLTQARLMAASDLDRLLRAKAEALDRLDYSYFNISIYENKYLDWEGVRDSWKVAAQRFVASVNQALQSATLNLIAFLFLMLPYVLYLFIAVVAAKYGWRVVKRIWKA